MQVRLVALALSVTAVSGVLTAVVGLPAQAGSQAAPSAPVMTAEAEVAPSPAAVAAQAPVRAAPPRVAPLKVVRRADLIVTLTRSLTTAEAARLRAVRGVQGLTVVDIGTVQVAGRGARVVGVDPSQFRQFTPRETAESDPLWAAVARGELVPTYGVQRERKLALGSTITVGGLRTTQERVGGVAAFGLPGIDVVTDRASARALGVVRDSAVVLDAPDRRISTLRRDVKAVLGDAVRLQVLRPEPVRASRGRPATYRDLYVQSARLCPGLRWQVLAAVGEVESGHGRNNGPSSAGALGPMQFLPSTWAAYRVDGDGDGKADIMSPYDAVPGAALYLCRNGAGEGPEGLYNALFAYNHADWYVKKVLATSERYG